MYTKCTVHYLLYIFILVITYEFHGCQSQTFDFTSSDFRKIAITSTFVDKTLLIKELLESNKTAMIAAPPKFGKSTNMDMIRRFLEIEVDDNGRPKTRMDYSAQSVKDTDNFRLFDDNNLKISKELNLMNEYFGRTPVLSVSFKCNRTLTNLEEAINHFKVVVHQTFKQYKYLVNSDKLASGHKQYIDSWCSETEYVMFGKQRVTSALRELAEYLYRHFNQRRVYVLIDDHDSAINKAMYNVTDDDKLDDIVRFSVCIMNALLKSNSRYVLGGLMTGVSDIPAFGSPAHNIDDPDSFQTYKFLGDHRFVDFYGLTEEEVEELMVYPKIRLGDHIVDRATDMYGGYQSVKGKEVYNLFSILNFLKSGEFQRYWPNSCPLQHLTEVVKFSLVNKSLNKLIIDKTVNVTIMKTVEPDDLGMLRDLIIIPATKIPKSTYLTKKYLFSLVEKGFLTYASDEFENEEKDITVSLKIPNEEIKEYFSDALK